MDNHRLMVFKPQVVQQSSPSVERSNDTPLTTSAPKLQGHLRGSRTRGSSKLHKPFKPPTRDPSVVWFDHLTTIAGPARKTAEKVRRAECDIRDAFATSSSSGLKRARLRSAEVVEHSRGGHDLYNDQNSQHLQSDRRPHKHSSRMAQPPVHFPTDTSTSAGTEVTLSDKDPPDSALAPHHSETASLPLDLPLTLLRRLCNRANRNLTSRTYPCPYDQALPYSPLVISEQVYPSLPQPPLTSAGATQWHVRLMRDIQTHAGISGGDPFPTALDRIDAELAVSLAGLVSM